MKKLNFTNETIKQQLYRGSFGLERETLRVNAGGFLAHTKDPFEKDPNITKDFCENQIEIVTQVADSPESIVQELRKWHDSVADRLLHLETGPEYIWPFSNPPFIYGEEDIPIAEFGEALRQKSIYRQYLAAKYGKKKMLFSGIHCNYSFSEELLAEGYRESVCPSLQAYKNDLYLELAKRLTQYSWLLVYLMAASPVTDDSFLDYATVGSRYASARCSELGYWNDFTPVLSYDSLEDYVARIQTYVDEGRLLSASELYYPIRLKPKGENSLNNLLAGGVNHIELRMLDVNPLTPVGIFTEDVSFIQLLIVYLLSLEEGDFDDETAQIAAIGKMKETAKFNVDMALRQEALEVLKGMQDFYVSLSAPAEVLSVLSYQRDKIVTPGKRYADILRERFEHDYTQKGLALAKSYIHREAHS